MSLPFLTTDFPGIGGKIKQRAEDFFVQEQPLYEPSGQGEHVYCEIQKVGITTFEAIDRIARVLNVSTREIGYAGMKDAQAISRQILSIRGTTEEQVMGLRIADLTVQWAARHGNKLRLGHLAGNRFAIKIRDVNPTDVIKLKPVVNTLVERGMPNYFGEQRFGRRGNNDLLGAALIRNDFPALLQLLLGDPQTMDDPKTRGARAAFATTDFTTSMRLWPRRSGMERRILARFIKTRNPVSASRAIDEKLRRLWISALQSKMFNEVVARRITTIDTILDGDMAYKHDNGACFHVESAEAEQARCKSFEISPTGPLVGYRMSMPEKESLRIEQEVLAEHGLAPENFRLAGHHKVKGARRPLRVQPKDVELAAGVDEFGGHITVAFTMPAGSFATVLMGELMKPDQKQSETDAEDADESEVEIAEE